MPQAQRPAGPTLACTFSGETARKLWANIRREQYGGHPVLERQAPFAAQLEMALLYFRWQWWRDADGQAPAGQRPASARRVWGEPGSALPVWWESACGRPAWWESASALQVSVWSPSWAQVEV